MSVALENLLGKPGEQPECRDFGEASVHWFPSDDPEAPCRCGKRKRVQPGHLSIPVEHKKQEASAA